jgi:hypothetical protein
VDTFLKTLDSAIQAEEQYGFPYDAGPESLYFNLEIRYPNNGRLTSSHKMKWSEPQKPAREPDELKDVAFEDFVLTETGRPVARGTRLRWNYRTGMLTVGEDEPIYAPHYRDNLRVHEKPPARPDLFWPEREWVSVGDGVQQVQFKKERV